MPPRLQDADHQHHTRVGPAHLKRSPWSTALTRVSQTTRLFDAFEIPGVKLAHNGMLLTYAEMVSRLGHERSAWLCGTAGWWMPSYHSVNAARGMSSGIVNAFPQQPRNLLKQVLDGGFEPDADYWTMVRIEQIRQREKENIALVIKHMQEVVGLNGGMNGDGAELSGDVKVEVENLLREGGWVA